MNEHILKQIKSKLKLECYLMNDEWLQDCIEFYVNQHENPSMQEILQFVKVQWQLSDLREINNNNGSLPHNLSEQKFVILSGNYILQIEQMYDIATSKYKQLEQIRNTHISEVEQSETEKMEKWKPPKKRMIQLRLTDGLQDVIGIEYNYISQLNDMLLPGYKVMIMGPVKCRKGVLLLEEEKLKGIGGEVDNLLIPNALENVLARALNLQENPDPYNDNETKSKNIKQEEPQIDATFFEDDFEINFENISKIEDLHSKDNKNLTETETRTKIGNTNTKMGNTNTKMGNTSTKIGNTSTKIGNTSTKIGNTSTKIGNTSTKIGNTSTKIGNTNTKIETIKSYEDKIIMDDDDCFLEMIDEKQLIEAEIEHKNIAIPFRTLPAEENNDIIIINDDEEINSSISTSSSKIKEKALSVGTKRNIPMSPPRTKTLKKSKTDRQITEFTKVINILEEPKICEFIFDINNEIVTKTIFKTVRGHVEILGKLTKSDLSWILEATIADGTGTINVSFANKVLEDLLGFSVQEFSVKKKLKKNPDIEHELRMSFRNAEQKIKTLDALLKLELNTSKKPTVIEINDLTQEQKEIFDRRLRNFLLKINK